MRPSDLEIEYKEQRIKTQDGAELNTWAMEPADKKANGITIIVVGSDAGNMGYTVFYAKNLVDLGYKVISFDYRGFGDSTDFEYNPNNVYHSEYVTDFATVVNWAKTDLRTESIGVFGLSMGTLIANLGYHKSKYDFLIGEAFLWSPSENRRRILELKNKELNLPKESISDEELVVKANVPTLLFAGKQDEITTLEDSKQICSTRNDSNTIIFDGGHLRGIVDLGVDEYFAAIDKFIQRY
jgi:alpha-beta hydrolase superfamily lysophospholipase